MPRYIPGNFAVKNQKGKSDYSYAMIIILIFFILIRSIYIINKNSERGALAYVQLLNFSVPVIGVQAFEEDVYLENNLSLKKVLVEALWLNNISSMNIVSKEVTLFGKGSVSETMDITASSLLKPYRPTEDSVIKITQEEIDELAKVSAAYDPKLKKTLDESKPEVLIYHTHTTEGYGLQGKNDTKDENANVVGVGDIIEKELEENYGISVIHDKTIHNSVYDESYIRSGETVQKYLDQYSDFKLIIDLHRDSVGKEYCTVDLNGQSLARIMYVTAQNSPRYKANKALADKFAAKAEELFPGLLRGVPVWDYESGQHQGFNSGMSDNFLLIEDGSITNTPQEARLSGKYISRLIAEYINGGN